MRKDRDLIHVAVIAPTLAQRVGLRALLGEGGIIVIGEASSLGEMETLPAETDVVVLASVSVVRAALDDLLSGGESHPAILLLDDDWKQARALIGLPGRAWGILPADVSADEWAAAVGALAEGLLAGAPALLERLLTHPSVVETAETEPLVEALTAREVEVLQWLARGFANKQIAVGLGISEPTVKFHVSSIYAKLDVASRTEAVRAGVRRGLVVL